MSKDVSRTLSSVVRKCWGKLTPVCYEVAAVRVRSGDTSELRLLFFVRAKLFNLIPIQIAIIDQSIQNQMAQMVQHGRLIEGDEGKENLMI